MTKVVCPGSFNPVTLGHMNVFERCSRLFDEVVVLVVHNAAKTYHVSVQQRVQWIREAVAHLPNVTVDAYSGLLVDYAASCGAQLLVKGVRDALDLVVETQMYYANREASKGEIDTMFLPTGEQFAYLSSSVVRDVASYGGDIDAFVPPVIRDAVARAYRK